MHFPRLHQEIIGDKNIVAAGDINLVIDLPAPDNPTFLDLRALLKRVQTYWIDDILEDLERGAPFLPLPGKELPEAVEHPLKDIREMSSTRAPIEEIDICTLFERFARTLLILGEAGAGKTTTLLQLARQLAKMAEKDPKSPVPIVLNLSTWSLDQPAFSSWLKDEMRSKYFIPTSIGEDWLRSHRLLLLLDGLDEVQDRSRKACVESVNDFVCDYGISGIAICCRRNEYESLETRLRLGGAIYITPLTIEAVEAYLRSRGTELSGLLELVRADLDLQVLATSPLMVNLMAAAFRGRQRDELQRIDAMPADSLVDRVIRAFVDRSFERLRETQLVFSRDKSQAYLSWIARRMTESSLSMLLVAEIQPAWLASTPRVTLYAVLSRVLIAAAVAFIAWVSLFSAFSVGVVLSPLVLYAEAISTHDLAQVGFVEILTLIAEMLLEGLSLFRLGAWQIINQSFWVAVSVGLAGGTVSALWDGHGLLTNRNQSTNAARRWALVWKNALLAIVVGASAGVIALPNGLSTAMYSALLGTAAYCAIDMRQRGIANRANDIRVSDHLEVSKLGAVRGAVRGGAIGASLGIALLVGLLLFGDVRFQVSMSSFQAIGVLAILSALGVGFAGVPFGALLGGITAGVPAMGRPRLSGLTLTVRSSFRAALIVGSVAGAGAAVSTGGLYAAFVVFLSGQSQFNTNNLLAPASGILIGVIWGVFMALFSGGLACLRYGSSDLIKHSVLRSILRHDQCIPWRIERFLDYTSKLNFTQQVGIGVRFTHRALQEFFCHWDHRDSR